MTKSQLAFEAHLKKRECEIGEGLNTNERVEAAEAWQASRKAALEEVIDCCKPKPYKGEGSFFPSPMIASEAQTRIKELLND
jgi:hypothetical protein